MFLETWQWLIRLTGHMEEQAFRERGHVTAIIKWFVSPLGEYRSQLVVIDYHNSLFWWYYDNFRFPVTPGWTLYPSL